MNKIKIIIATLCVAAIGAAIFIGCKKENIDNNLINQKCFNQDGMLYFSNIEEFNNTLTTILEFDFDELCAYEDSLGYTSFGRECEEIYNNSLEIDSLNSDEEIETFVSQHNNNIQIINDYDNELLYVPILFDHPFRYILNNNRMFQIEDTIYKVFNIGIVNTNYENVSALINLQENELSSIDSTSIFSFAPSAEPYILPENFNKDNEHNLGGKLFSAKIINKERVRINIERAVYYGTNMIQVMGIIDIRGFRKICNHWCNAKRTISYQVNVGYHYIHNNSYCSNTYYSLNYTTSRPVFKRHWTFANGGIVRLNNEQIDYLFHFASANGYVSIPAVTNNFNFY